MGAALLLMVLALIIGGVGLFVSALTWALVIAAVLFVAGGVAGWARRSATV